MKDACWKETMESWYNEGNAVHELPRPSESCAALCRTATVCQNLEPGGSRGLEMRMFVVQGDHKVEPSVRPSYQCKYRFVAFLLSGFCISNIPKKIQRIELKAQRHVIAGCAKRGDARIKRSHEPVVFDSQVRCVEDIEAWSLTKQG
jgi:hypothetical protein